MILAAVSRILKDGTADKLDNDAIFMASAIDMPAGCVVEVEPEIEGFVSSIVMTDILGSAIVPVIPLLSALIKAKRFSVESVTDMLATCVLALTAVIWFAGTSLTTSL